MLRRALSPAALAITLLTASLAGAQDPPPTAAKPIDLVICLDCSNSMDGLIGSAKAKLWDIVNDLAKAKPTPVLRVALYSYGNDTYDASVGWVRKDLDFTADLDKVNEKLFGLTTKGGTEYVARVCKAALDQLAWSKEPGALKIIFVCGNEPASQDKTVHLKDVAEQAVRADVVITPIYCGNPADSDASDWKQFADLTEGRFVSINQDKGTVAVATPFDAELAKLSNDINATFCFAGKKADELKANQAAQDRAAAGVAPGVAAARAATKGGALYRFEDDLVEKCKRDPNFDVKKVPAEELPEDLKKMTPEEREKHVKGLLAKREAIQKKIADLTAQREKFLAEERKKNNSQADKTFDEAVRGLLREQAKKKGVAIP
jgi:hypothetical protein